MPALTRWPVLSLLLLALVACASALPVDAPTETPSAPPAPVQKRGSDLAAHECPLTEPSWVKPPEDSAVLNEPAFGYYFVNADQSIWASAWGAGYPAEYPLRAGPDGNKMGWFRPAGATLEITGQRLDAAAPPLEAHLPCCYPTRFQASGVSFPTKGCWEVVAKAAESELTFVVWVEP